METTARSEITLRSRDIGTEVPRSGETSSVFSGAPTGAALVVGDCGDGAGGEHILLADAATDARTGARLLRSMPCSCASLRHDRGHVPGAVNRVTRRSGWSRAAREVERGRRRLRAGAG